MVANSTERLQWLTNKIAEGWQLEAPVIERPAYRDRAGCASAFEFILRHERGRQAVAVADCPELHSFLIEHGIEVVFL